MAKWFCFYVASCFLAIDLSYDIIYRCRAARLIKPELKVIHSKVIAACMCMVNTNVDKANLLQPMLHTTGYKYRLMSSKINCNTVIFWENEATMWCKFNCMCYISAQKYTRRTHVA